MDKETIKGILAKLRLSIGDEILLKLLAMVLTKENIIGAVDALLDVCEDIASKTATKVDDEVLRQIRATLAIPDNDKPKADGEPGI